jgi:enterochelin esterase family protein
LWIATAIFPTDARLDYKLYRNNSTWMLDPVNPLQQVGGFGANSELRMPDYIPSTDVIPRDDIPTGTLSAWQMIDSESLGYTVEYRIYTPHGYIENELADLPTIYVLDGNEYSDPEMGSMITVLDNLIVDGRIQPVIAVFIDPRNPRSRTLNRRMTEYASNPDFSAFVAEELVPVIDEAYRTSASADHRAIMGTSMGGQASAYIGMNYADVFGLIGIQSPALTGGILLGYVDNHYPVRVFLSSGNPRWDADIRSLTNSLTARNYDSISITVNEGHSWGNWRALLDDLLIYFFGV